MPKLSDLGLTNDRVGDEITYDNIPDQMGSFAPPPPPGDYRFRFPQNMGAIWDTVEKTKGKNLGKRVVAIFDSSAPLVIIQSPGNEHNGEPFETRISNVERKRGKRDDLTAPEISDMDYIFRDVVGLKTKPGDSSNQAYVQEFMKLAGKEMGARIEWRWTCSETREARWDNGQGGFNTYPDDNNPAETRKGCGAAYYQNDVEKVPSDPNNPASPKVFPLRITCGGCGASLRAFAGLSGFKK